MLKLKQLLYKSILILITINNIVLSKEGKITVNKKLLLKSYEINKNNVSERKIITNINNKKEFYIIKDQ